MGISELFPALRQTMGETFTPHRAHISRVATTVDMSSGETVRGSVTTQYAALPCYVFVPRPKPGETTPPGEFYVKGAYEMRVFDTPLDITTDDIVDAITNEAGTRLFELTSAYRITDITPQSAQTVIRLQAISPTGTA